MSSTRFGRRRAIHARALAMMAAAILIMLLPQSANQTPGPVGFGLEPRSELNPVLRPRGAKSEGAGISSFVKTVDVRFWITEGAPVDFTDVSRIDLRSMDVSSLVAQTPMNAVLQLPTIESIEPIYWYTSDLPGVSGFASGINYALALIRDTLPGLGGSSRKLPDLGARVRFDWTRTC